ncbi:MAG: hypothetical protein M9899_07680 [Bdellovibrionaceae bacterium]|nr:hypothetical protein [Pseudobdellovibrionaceae bacterium]
MGRHTLITLLLTAFSIPQMALAMDSAKLLQCLNQSEQFYKSSLYGFEKSVPGYDVKNYKPNLPGGNTHYSLVPADGFDFKVENDFAYLDSYTHRGNVKRTIITPDGELTCVFEKEHLDSVKMYPRDMQKDPPRISRVRGGALGINIMADIDCTKSSTPSDKWEKMVENYFKGINRLYSDDLFHQMNEGTLDSNSLKRQSGADLLRRYDKNDMCSSLSPHLRTARAQALTNLYATEVRFQERVGTSGGGNGRGGTSRTAN